MTLPFLAPSMPAAPQWHYHTTQGAARDSHDRAAAGHRRRRGRQNHGQGVTITQPLTVYSKPNCRQCEATKRWLEARDIPHQIASAETNRDKLLELGHSQVPVVVTPDGHHWAGFDPFELEQYQKKGQEKGGK